MGSVHKFKRPPRNKQQFKGYRPNPPGGPPGGPPRRWALRDWQKSVLAWAALLLAATAFWALGHLL